MKNPQRLQEFEEELMKSYNHQQAHRFSAAMSTQPALGESQPATRLLSAADIVAPSVTAAAMQPWHSAAAIQQGSQEAARKRRQEAITNLQAKRQNLGQPSQPATGARNPGGKNTPKTCGACGQAKVGHKKGSCPTHCMKCRKRKEADSRDKKWCQSCEVA